MRTVGIRDFEDGLCVAIPAESASRFAPRIDMPPFTHAGNECRRMPWIRLADSPADALDRPRQPLLELSQKYIPTKPTW
jgi:hypothetical protein